MPNGKGMTRSERTSYSIAQQFCAAVNRLENFTDNPEMVYDDILGIAQRCDQRTRDTVQQLVLTLRDEKDTA